MIGIALSMKRRDAYRIGDRRIDDQLALGINTLGD